jgi:hypothetical protein
MKPTRYLVQLHDNSLHGYDREDLLRCDLASNKDCPPKRIFRLCETSVTIRYDVIDIAEIAPSLSGSIPSTPVPLTKQLAA